MIEKKFRKNFRDNKGAGSVRKSTGRDVESVHCSEKIVAKNPNRLYIVVED